MNTLFAETLKKLRKEKGLSQVQLGNLMFVNKSTVARWETGLRLPDAAMITRLSRILGVGVGTLLSAASESEGSPNIILVDDNIALIPDSLYVLEKVLPNATITGFNLPLEAIEYAKVNRTDLAILDIELGTSSGFDLCHRLLEINPCIYVVYLTAYPDYALDAWSTDAYGFIVKPLTAEGFRRQLKKMRFPFPEGGSANERLE